MVSTVSEDAAVVSATDLMVATALDHQALGNTSLKAVA